MEKLRDAARATGFNDIADHIERLLTPPTT